MLRDDEYLRLQTIFLAIAKHSDQPPERARWLALVHSCQEELLTAGETRAILARASRNAQSCTSMGSALHSDLARLAIAACHRSAKDTNRQPCTAIDQGGDRAGSKEKPSAEDNRNTKEPQAVAPRAQFPKRNARPQWVRDRTS
jgi:hypothetical protein